MRTALVIGAGGQDGKLLCESLKASGVRVRPLLRGGPVDVLEPLGMNTFIGRLRPDEIYYLAAFHHSSEDPAMEAAELFRRSTEVHFQGLVHVLEAMAQRSPASRLFYAASSHVFGLGTGKPLDETAALRPANAYGVTKAAGMLACRYYREQRGLFASCGILFNHESHLRSPKFVSRKIVRAAAAAKKGVGGPLVLGDLAARVDWGYAPDYVEAMRAILAHESAEDFVVASGRAHSVEDFAKAAFGELGLDWRKWVKTDPSVLTKKQSPLVGDASKLAAATGWRPKTTFAQMVRALVRAEMRS